MAPPAPPAPPATAIAVAAAATFAASISRPFPTFTPSGHPYTPTWRRINPALRHVRIFSVGLQKTGSTSAGWALVDAGIRVAHNAGDDLSDLCQSAFTPAYNYSELRRRHPDAAWLITYASNFTAWSHSLRYYHLQTTKALRKGMPFMPAHFFQGRHALTEEMLRQNVNVEKLVPLDPKTAWVRPEHEPLLELLWRTYYQRVFAFFDAELGMGRYAVADVRAKRYTGFEYLQGVNVTTPFGVYNKNLDPLNKPRSSWYGKTTCCYTGRPNPRDPFGNPCPEELMADERHWDWCAKTKRYIRRATSAAGREQKLRECDESAHP